MTVHTVINDKFQKKTAKRFVRNCSSLLGPNIPMTPSSDKILSGTMRRLKVRFIETVGDALGVIHATFQDDLPRGSSEIVHPSWLGSKVAMTSTSDEIFSQTLRRLKMSFIGSVGTTLGVMHAKFQDNLPRGLSEIIHRSWLGSKVAMTPSSDEIFSQTMGRLKMRFVGTIGTTIVNIYAKFEGDLPRGSSVIVPPSWI